MSNEKNKSKYTKQSKGRPRDVTSINLLGLLKRVKVEGINVSEFVREKLKEHFLELDRARYLDYKNNFLSVEKFAGYYGITIPEAEKLILDFGSHGYFGVTENEARELDKKTA